jgi:peptidoglycan biosynthesis protein MviN/MurJ (putative lipid II flippase)
MQLSLLLGILSAAQIIFGFVTTAYVLFAVGPGPHTDALIAGQTLPVLLVSIIGVSIVNILVPLLSSLAPAELATVRWPILLWTFAVFALSAFAMGMLAPYWSPLIFPGFGEEAARLTVALVRIQLLGMIFAGINAVLTAFSRIAERFVFAEAVPAALTFLTVVALFFLVPRYGVYAAAWLWTARLALQALVMIPLAGPPTFRDLRSKVLVSIWARLRPLILGASIFKLAPVVDRYFASSAAAGSVALLNLSTQMCAAGGTVLERAIITPVIPSLARAVQKNDLVWFRRQYRKRLLISAGLVVGAYLLLILVFPFVEHIVAKRGWMEMEQLQLLFRLTLLLAGACITMAAGPIMVAGFYAMGDSVTPTILGLSGFAASIILKYIGFAAWGMEGLVVATSTYYVGNLLIGSLLLERKISRAQV